MKIKVTIAVIAGITGFLSALSYNPTASNHETNGTGQDRLIKRALIQRMVQGEWQEVRSEDFTYNDNGKVLTHVFKVKKEGDWVNQNKLEYEYDHNSGQEIKRTWSNWVNDKWELKLRFSRSQDTSETLVEELVDEYQNGEWKIARKNISQHHPETSHKIDQTYYNFTDDEWKPSWQDRYEFEDSNLIKKVGYSWANDSWTKTLLTAYRYDSRHGRTEESILRVKGDTKQNWRKTSFIYEGGLKTSEKTEVWKNEAWEIAEIRKLTYY